MPLSPEDLGPSLGMEVTELVKTISMAKRAIKDIKEAYGGDELEKRLKKILYEMVAPDENGHHAVIVDGVKAKVFMRNGRMKIDMDAAKRLLHPNTFRTIFQDTDSYPVLEVEPSRTPPALDRLFIKRGGCENVDSEDYYS